MANQDRARVRENDYSDVRDRDRLRPKETSNQFRALTRTLTPIWECYTCRTILPADVMVCKCGETLGHALLRLPTYIKSAWACRQSHVSETRGHKTVDVVSVGCTDMQCKRRSMNRARQCTSRKGDCAMAEFMEGLREFRRGVVEELQDRRRFVIGTDQVMEEWAVMYEKEPWQYADDITKHPEVVSVPATVRKYGYTYDLQFHVDLINVANVDKPNDRRKSDRPEPQKWSNPNRKDE